MWSYRKATQLILPVRNETISRTLTCLKGTSLHQTRGSGLRNGRAGAPYVLLPLRKHLKIFCERKKKKSQRQNNVTHTRFTISPNYDTLSKWYKRRKSNEQLITKSLKREIHGLRSLAVYSPWDSEADVTEPLTPPSTKRKGFTAATYWTPLQSPFNGGITGGTEKMWLKTPFYIW